ncbi:hypothetical protein CPJCM30710_00360 [Clostridium polyendosporum]|uniref:Uncharacterized protein n=1 Tax=Clostridium polyendosporum TaxID=69208 RepID=A0A919RXQ6_9CLOT|nr:hypothetical protein [Clostridium polyendosporum]GIM27370.1 hypothetical protein CPJCM30710_00360 [Clostridium polyendosporum]
MKKKFILTSIIVVALTAPTIAYAQLQNTPDIVENQNENSSIEQKFEKGKAKLEERKDRLGIKDRDHHDKLEKQLLKAEGLTKENKQALERAIKKRTELREEMFNLIETKIDNKEGNGVSLRDQTKAIKDKVDNKQISENEAKKQLEELREKRKQSFKNWKNSNKEAKQELDSLKDEMDKWKKDHRVAMDEFEDAVDDKNTNAINEASKKLTASINEHNKLLQKKINVLNKYTK